jgi:hypothetical protein
MPRTKPKAAKKPAASKKATSRNSDGLEYVIATLPNGAKLRLYGDAVAAAKRKRKTSYKEASAEQIEKWAIAAVADFDEKQNLALVSLLREFSKYAARHRDAVGSVISTALYAAFKESTGLHDDAIKAVVGEGSIISA